jgi:hypothetical protein
MLTANCFESNDLVNGSLGTIHNIGWEEGKGPSNDLPLAIMFFEDTRTVPVFLALAYIPKGVGEWENYHPYLL